MSAQVDLHLHTTASDGRLSPAQLIRLVAQRGLRVVAITDHDSTEGIPEAQAEAGKYPALTLIPGVEFSTDVPESEIHLLGYFLDPMDQELQQVLRRSREGREIRARRMIERLASLGVSLEWHRVAEVAGGGAIGRPHIAQAMVEKGYVSQPQEAFTRYIGRNGPAYVEREKHAPEETVRLVQRHGGLAVLAHPAEVKGLDVYLPRLVTAGLVGLEVFYGNYTSPQVQLLLELAYRYRLVPCGGSDYHALGTPGEVEPGTVGPPLESARRLQELAAARGPLVR